MIRIRVRKKLSGGNGDFELRLDTEVAMGTLLSIYGSSGAGKTSILRMLAGLMNPDDGLIVVDDNVWFERENGINIRPQQRNIGMVFQEYSLFPNMTVRENLEYALHKGQSNNVVNELLALTEMEQLQHQRPALLSGGQKQRVALARALVRKPTLLLLDEPLSAVDMVMRARLQDYILEAHQRYQLTTILVSHDITEVIKLSDRVLLLDEGVVKDDGAPLKVLPIQSFFDSRKNVS